MKYVYGMILGAIAFILINKYVPKEESSTEPSLAASRQGGSVSLHRLELVDKDNKTTMILYDTTLEVKTKNGKFTKLNIASLAERFATQELPKE